MDNEIADDYQPPRNGWRTFLTLWSTQSFSEFGTQVTFFSITIWMAQVLFGRPEQKSDLAWALAAEGIVFTVAGLIATPLAGAWADRHDRKLTILVTNLASGAVTAVLVALLATNSLQLWMWLVIAACLSALSAFHSTAFSASIVMLVRPQQLTRASAMTHTALAFTGIMAPVFAAAIIAIPTLLGQDAGSQVGQVSTAHRGVSLAVTVDVMTYVVAAIAGLLLTIPSPRRSDLRAASGRMERSVLADIKEGARYIWQRSPLVWLLSLFTVANVLLFPSVLLPLVVKFNLAPDWTAQGMSYEAALALISTTVGIAGVIWGSIVAVWGGLKRRRVYAVIVPLMVAGLAQVGLGLSVSTYVAAAMVFVMIGMGAIMGAHMAAIWQTQTPRQMQGRVSAMRRVIVQCGAPLGMAFAGWAGGAFDPGHVMAGMGALIAIYSLAQLFNRSLARVEDRTYVEGIAAQNLAGSVQTPGP